MTGSPGAGKNTIATLYARRLEHCALIDVDIVRWMVLQPHKAPWEGNEGKAQQKLGVKNTCLLARNFRRAGFHVIIVDILSDETARIYKTELEQLGPVIILLSPSLEEVEQRNFNRGQRLESHEVKMLYEQQQAFTGYDQIIDNTNLTAEETADILVLQPQLLKLWRFSTSLAVMTTLG